jgi:phage repressor protein C with HTH and peptisase S24 domain
MDEIEIKKRVRMAINKVISDRNLSNKALASLMKSTPTTVSNYRTAKNMPKASFLSQFCNDFMCNQQWVMTGQGRPFLDSSEDNDEMFQKYWEISSKEAGDHESSTFQIVPAQADFPADDFVFIRQVNGKISAGGGLVPDDSVDVRAAFRKDYIKRKGGKPDDMSLIKVSGDSMEPTLLDGDLVLVNHARNTVSSHGGIYAISTIDSEISIKRVQPNFPDKLLVISDNRKYPSQEMAAENVRVNGKVIWYARDLER